MDAQAVSSVMQLSTFTKITSIPREEKYADFPVTVRVKAAEMAVHQRAPVDIVAVLDISRSMDFPVLGTSPKKNRLDLVKDAMAKVIANLGGAADNRLAVVAFHHEIHTAEPLTAMTDQGQRAISDAVNALTPIGMTTFSLPLTKAAKILDDRGEAEKEERLGFIIFLSDGEDDKFSRKDVPAAYPIHAFGFSADHDPSALQAMAEATSGSYTSINQDLEKITEKLDQLSDKLSTIVAVDTRIGLKSLHPGVSLSRVESSADNVGAGDCYKGQIADDRQSGEISLGAVSSGKEREFTVYLDVPEGQGSGAGGEMQLLAVSGGYTQSWDKKQVALDESVVTVKRPESPPPSSCKEMDLIEERLEYWCKVKLELSAMYDKAETEAGKKEATGGDVQSKCHCQFTKALREASLEAINKAMHQDIYTAVLHVIKLRHGGAAAESAASPPAPEPAKAD